MDVNLSATHAEDIMPRMDEGVIRVIVRRPSYINVTCGSSVRWGGGVDFA